MKARTLAVLALVACVLCAPGLGWARQAESPVAARDAGPENYSQQGDAGLVREVRLALVCYGGSSLAIYMHGNTKELFRLVQASKALELDAKADPAFRNAVLNNGRPVPSARFQTLTGSARQWYERLLELWETDPKKVRTRVVIDVIAGTSAGGINGVILAKALAHDVPVDGLTELWMTKASLAKLTHHYFGLLRVLAGRAPVDGDALLGWLHGALASMDKADAGRHSLLPAGDRLDLFVTATDRYGYPQNLVVGDPDSAAEARHRHVLHFIYPGSKRGCGPEVKDDHFCPYWTPALAFAARVSSSIPGVFPPLGLPQALKTIGPASAKTLQHDMATDLFRNYQLQQPTQDDSYLEKTFFVDGGVLDNHPFDPAIAEVFNRSQNREVRRFLIYLQPDPGKPPVGASGKEPSLLPTIWAGLSGLPSGQPILDSLSDVAEHNVRLDRLRDIVRAEEQEARAREQAGGGGGDCSKTASLSVAEQFGCAMKISPQDLDSKLDTIQATELAEWRHTLEKAAREGTNDLADRTYISVRVHSVLDQLVTVIASEHACNYPTDSAHRALVLKIVERWAVNRQLISSPDHPGGDLKAQLDFLEKFDVGYLRRQLRFVVDWVNIQYEEDKKRPFRDPALRRRQLDEVKTAASREIDKLTSFVEGTSAELAGGLGEVKTLFCGLRPWKEVGKLSQPLDEQADAFVRDPQKLAALDSLRSQLGSRLFVLQQEVREESLEAFKTLTADWKPAEDRREILVRYLGFPFWDRQIYPLLAFADIGELDQIKVFRLSPDDATLLGGGPASEKLKGAQTAHFGAFFSRPGREGDYLWGRLDAGERLLKLLGLSTAGAKPLFTAILDEEQKDCQAQNACQVRKSIIDDRRKRVAALP